MVIAQLHAHHNIFLNKNMVSTEQYVGNVISLGLKPIFTDYLKNNDNNIEGRNWTLYYNAYTKKLQSIKLERVKTEETTYRNNNPCRC